MVKRSYGKLIINKNDSENQTEKIINKNSSVESVLEMGILKSISLFDVDYAKKQTDSFSPAPKLSPKNNELTEFELGHIDFVSKSMSVFVDESTCSNVIVATSLLQCFQMPDIYFKWAIKFCKRFPAFSCLNSSDQFALFKPFAYDILTIRMVFNFDLQKNGFLMFTVLFKFLII